MISKAISYIKNFIPNMKIRNRLLFSSIFITTVVIISLYILSSLLLSNFIIQKQSDYETASLKQVNNFFRSIFSSSEGYVETLYKSAQIKELLTQKYIKDDPIALMQYLGSYSNNVNTILINKDYMESVILVGRNNFACSYTQKEELYETADLTSDLDFNSFISNSFLSASIQQGTYPYYFNSEDTYKPKGISEKKIENTINKKIIMIKLLKSETGIVDGVIIVTFKNNIAESIIPSSPYRRLLYLSNDKGKILWTNNSEDNLNKFVSDDLAHSDSSKVSKKSFGREEYVATYKNLEPYKFKIASITPVKAFFEHSSKDRWYSLLFGICCILFTSIFSYFMSNIAVKKLENFGNQLKGCFNAIPEKVNVIDNNKIYGRFSLKIKIFLQFSISIILPMLLFICFITYFNYNSSKEKVFELANNSVKQAKWNIDYKLSNYNKLSVQIIFSENIQNAFDEDKYKNNNYEIKLKIGEDFLIRKIKNKDLLSLSLYKLDYSNLYSNIYFDTLPITNVNSSFPKLMENSSNGLVYLDTYNDYIGLGPIMLFSRNIRSSGAAFGSLLGYMSFCIDQEAFFSILREPAQGISGQYFLIDDRGSVITDSTDMDSISTISQTVNLNTLSMNKSPNTFVIGNKKYILFNEALSLPSLKIIGLVPLEEITQNVYPIIKYSLLLLAAFTVLILMLATYISYGILKPIRKLEEIMEEIRNENFNVQMDYKGNDEIAILADNFNLMVNRLNQLIYENYQSKMHESELMFLEKEAQLNALQQQINPHFLYNTLESIKWMAYRIDAIEICNMATALGKFFRGSITKGKEFITLGQEIDHLESYIYIQKIRYQGKLDINIDIADELKDYKVIKLLLQPLVENAIIHGTENMKSGGLVNITANKLDDSIQITVTDNGSGIDPNKLNSIIANLSSPGQDYEKNSIGLSNVYRRLKLYFGEKSSFELISEEGLGTTVKIRVPII